MTLFEVTGHLLDLLQGSAVLAQAGSIWSSGWPGVTRPDAGIAAAAGFINLYDSGYQPAGADERPAIYLGSHSLESLEWLETPLAVGASADLYIAVVQLVVACSAPVRTNARRQRDQLTANLHSVLANHLVESGWWYELRIAPSAGGEMEVRRWMTSTGSGSQMTAEAVAVLPLRMRYSF